MSNRRIKMTDSMDTVLIEDLAREVVGEVAPDELMTFQRTVQAFRADPEGTLGSSKGGDEPLGFGVDGLMVFVAPAALAVAGEVLKYVYQELRDVLVSEGRDAFAARIRRLFRDENADGGGDNVGLVLSREQLVRIHEIAKERAKQFLPTEEAGLLADSMAGALAVSPS